MALQPSTALSLLPSNPIARPQPLKTGSPQLDEYTLGGGIQRGSVIGLSTEDEDLGLLISLQTISNLIVSTNSEKALLITAQPIQSLLPTLRKTIINTLSSTPGSSVQPERVKECLRRVQVSRVFDITGLEEVLTEVETQAQTPRADAGDDDISIVVITNMPILLNTLFGNATGKERQEVHERVGQLGERLRGLASGIGSTRVVKRQEGEKVVMLLNSVSSTIINRGDEPKGWLMEGDEERGRGTDAWLRSIFAGGQGGRNINKRPAYGQVFGRLVDLNLMGSKVPVKQVGTRERSGWGKEDWVWVLEVLLDQVGIYDLERMERRDREGRWAVVEVEEGTVV
ncbi:hypothetical protein QBC43DRAFT_309387 [Cladorrhinum sp. PSN259]|nr:hypothetical protein QBC43DRAFT_309387 [Cladorrhinum sp. PSN259]